MTIVPVAFGPAVEPKAFRAIQNTMALDFCKWDAQASDVSSLFPQPLFISRDTWNHLCLMAESLAAELTLAELELLERPDLHARLGLPAEIRSTFRDTWKREQFPPGVRTVRFDFHYTTDGWRISEVNSDVPGGYTEASRFTELMGSHCSGTEVTGDPAGQWSKAVLSVVGENGAVAFLSAPGFLEDQQVTAFLASQLQALRIHTVLLHSPSQLSWNSDIATAILKGKEVQVDAIVRFYQGEWLCKLPSRCGWKQLLGPIALPVINPASALLTESKRFPLTWHELAVDMPTWRRLLPACHDPGDVRWSKGSWVMKAAFSNTGDEVHIFESMERSKQIRLRRCIEKHPHRWVAQRGFEPIAVLSEVGPLYPCLGVYCINGRAAGVYARASSEPVVDYRAFDIALLLHQEKDASQR